MRVSELQILSSAAGYYIGRTYQEEDNTIEFPYSRESEYFDDKDEILQCFRLWNTLDKLKVYQAIKEQSQVDEIHCQYCYICINNLSNCHEVAGAEDTPHCPQVAENLSRLQAQFDALNI